MVFKGLFDRFSKKTPASAHEPPVSGDDGWVELVAGKVVVHDPVNDGRYATITPEGGVRLFVNGEEVREATAVTASDTIRFEVDADPIRFFEIAVAADEMTATLLLTADPFKIPDTVTMTGHHQVRLQPDYSARTRSRPFAPKPLILDHLRNQGIHFGIDEAAIEREIVDRTAEPVVVARGQQPTPPVAGQWVWRLDELSLAEAGQVIAEYVGEQPNQERITVFGRRTRVYDDLPAPQGYLAGNGTRLVPGGKLVASASGRARAVSTPQGSRVHLFPARKVEGDLEGELQVTSDLIVTGHVRGAKVSSTGEVLVLGNVDNSELHGEVVTVLGTASESQLTTVQPGHFAMFRAELGWISARLEALRDVLQQNKRITDDAFRELQSFVRGLRRRSEAMSVRHPDFLPVLEDLTRVFMGPQGLPAVDLGTVGRLILGLGKVLKAAEQSIQSGRDIRVATVVNSTLWAGRDITLTDSAVGARFYAGGSIRTATPATLIIQSELSAGGEIKVGCLGVANKSSTVVALRSAGKFEVEEAHLGTSFEFGGERKVLEQPITRITAQVNAKGQLIFRQREA